MALMGINDAKAVIKDLVEKPFICSKHTIETDSGYVITTKEKSKYARVKKQTNYDRIKAMEIGDLANFLMAFHMKFGEEYEGWASCVDWLQSEVEE